MCYQPTDSETEVASHRVTPRRSPTQKVKLVGCDGEAGTNAEQSYEGDKGRAEKVQEGDKLGGNGGCHILTSFLDLIPQSCTRDFAGAGPNILICVTEVYPWVRATSETVPCLSMQDKPF